MLHRITTPLPANTCPQGGGKQHERFYERIWKAAHIIYILYYLAIGILLLCLPWWKVWDDNYLLYLYPRIQPLVANPFFKGFVVGLGIINILMGIQEFARVKSIWKRGFLSQ
jgi:hypothetical protein